MNFLNKQAKIDTIINVIYYFLIIFLGIIIFKFLFNYLFPFGVASAVAYLMQNPAKKIAKKFDLKSGSIAAVLALLLYLLLVVLLGFIGYKSFYYLFAFSQYFIKRLPNFLENIKSIKILSGLPTEYLETFKSIFSNVANTVVLRVTDYISSLAASVAKAMPLFILSSIVALVATCYIAKDFEKLSLFFKNLCGSKIYQKTIKIKEIVSESVFKILKGYIILSAITFVEVVIGLLLLKTKYALIIAALISLVDLLPVLGVGSVLLPWAIYEIIFASTLKGIRIAILYLVVILIRNFLEPKIISKQIGIHPLFTLVSIFIGLKLIGFWGLFIFPITLIVVIKYYKNELESNEGLSN